MQNNNHTLPISTKEAAKIYSNLKCRLKKKGIALDDSWSADDFIKWYIKQERKCYHCNSQESEVQAFYNCHPSKRSNRGRRLELDRKDPNGPYSAENCVLACYYCNNAKSDVFAPKEFHEIGKTIGRTIRKVTI